MHKTALVIGATSSIGTALCRQLSKQGWSLIISGSSKNDLKRLSADLSIRYGNSISAIDADFTSPDFSTKPFEKAAKKCNSAFMLSGNMGSGEKYNTANIQNVININFTIPAMILTVIAKEMEERGHGEIAVVTSVAAERGRQSNYPYGSAKSGLDAFASGLRNRLYDNGVHVMTVRPGFIDTPMTYSLDSPLIASRECAAAEIIKSLENHKNICYVPFFWRYIMLIIKHIPENIFKKMSL